VNYVSWGDSARFANWLHNGQVTGAQGLATTEDGAYYLNGATTGEVLLAVTRKSDWQWAITSEDEWYKAAYYDPNKAGGAGYWTYPTRSNAVPGRDMADPSGNDTNYYTFSGAYPIDSGKYTTVAGQFQNSASAYGTFDQGGNVWEWNEAVISGYYRGLRGGSFGHDGNYLQSSYRGYCGRPDYEDYVLGFRLSQVPEPSSIIALLGGMTGLIGLRRRKASTSPQLITHNSSLPTHDFPLRLW
jgi:sulfatase modifying factor 1